ncbi:MAG: SRPBCC domain-containing protein [Gemmatimonadetes bacterium]|nr:SRPBCC domain-containing protein [Gemmatimonadota bacterium]
MPDILFDFPVAATPDKVFEAVATPDGLPRWWTRTPADGDPAVGAVWGFDFGPKFQWQGVVRRFEPGQVVEWELTKADPDWRGTRVRVELEAQPGGLTWVRFAHEGWADAGEHYRISAYCWAMYLRLLKHWVQRGETVPYDRRLEI